MMNTECQSWGKKTQKCSSLTLLTLQMGKIRLREINFFQDLTWQKQDIRFEKELSNFIINSTGKQHKDFHWGRKRLQLDKKAEGENFPIEQPFGVRSKYTLHNADCLHIGIVHYGPQLPACKSPLVLVLKTQIPQLTKKLPTLNLCARPPNLHFPQGPQLSLCMAQLENH